MQIICTICTELLDVAENLHVTKCGHLFHFDCLSDWIKRSQSCPQCRSTVNASCTFPIYPTISDEIIVDPMQAVLDETLQQIQKMHAASEEKDDRLRIADEDLKKNEELLKTYTSELDSLNSVVDILKEQLDAQTLLTSSHVYEEVAYWKQETQQWKDETKKLKDEIQRLKNETQTLKDENKNFKDENQSLKDETQCLKDENQSLKDENQNLKDENQSLKDENQNLKVETQSNISPFSYGLVVKQVYDSGTILDIKPGDLRAKFLAGVANVAAVSLTIGYPTLASAPHSIANGFKNLLAIAAVTDVEFKEAETIKEYIKDPSKFAAVAATGAPAAAAPAAEKKEKEASESDDDMYFGLFD